MTMSWAPEVFVEGKWAGNALRFATKEEAEESGTELLSRWWVPTDSRAVPSEDQPNYQMVDGRPVRLCSEGGCGLPVYNGDLCAGHNRLMGYDPAAEIAAND